MGVLAILLTGALYTLNPIEQLNKAFDAQKRSELRELKTAMDSYYNDFKCYPLKNSFDSFSGKDWKIGTIMYMKKVPKDLTYVTDYMMVTPTPGVIYCPQWYFFGIKKRSAGVSPGTGSDCPLEGSSCMPQKAVVTGTPGQLNPSDYICSYGGDVTSNNCSSLHGQIIP